MGHVEVFRGNKKLRAFFYSDSESPASSVTTGYDTWSEDTIESVFIPVKEMHFAWPWLPFSLRATRGLL